MGEARNEASGSIGKGSARACGIEERVVRRRLGNSGGAEQDGGAEEVEEDVPNRAAS